MKWLPPPFRGFKIRPPKDVVTIDLTSEVPEPEPWKPLVMDTIPEDPDEERITYVIMPMPDDPFDWMMKNLHNPSPRVAIYFVPTDFLDIEVVREDVRNFESRDLTRFFPDGYQVVGNRTVLDHCFNVVLPERMVGNEH